jgi:hypothetical protein
MAGAEGAGSGEGSDSSNENPNTSTSSNGGSPQPQTQPASTQTQSKSDTSPQPPLQKSTPDDKPSAGLETPTPFFEQSPTNANPPVLPSVLSPMTTPPSAFVQSTPMSGYEDFVRTTSAGSDTGASPPFMMDWAHMQMGGYGTISRPDLMLATDMGLDMTGMPTSAHTDNILTMMPEFAHALPVPTPLTTPRMDIHATFPDLELGSSQIFHPSRHPSMSDSGIADLGPVVAAQDGWNCFKCMPPIPPSSCPRTARLNLERLEQCLRNHEVWSKWRPTWDEADFANGEYLTVIQLAETTRDKLLAITQTFLHKALEIHKETGATTPGVETSSLTGSNFVLLPPARVLECFLRAYGNCFERFFPLTSRGILDANELMSLYNDKAGSLLVLMMIAQGAMAMQSPEGRWLTGGLTEACRISLFDLIEKNIIMASDPIVSRSALLFIVQAAWSGDKWQMDIAMGQRGMYVSMLRHSGVLEPRHAPVTPQSAHPGTTDSLWNDWIAEESRSR